MDIHSYNMNVETALAAFASCPACFLGYLLELAEPNLTPDERASAKPALQKLLKQMEEQQKAQVTRMSQKAPKEVKGPFGIWNFPVVNTLRGHNPELLDL